jgi:beta-mannan synthase
MNNQSDLSIRYYFSELFVGTCIILCGCYDMLYSKKGYYIYLFLQGMAFLIVGFGYVGTVPPSTG